MSKKAGVVLSILCVAAVVLSAVSLLFGAGVLKKAEAEKEGDIQYVLYLGTNDKDTNEPVFAPEEAKEQAEKILLNHFGGYTIQDADGGWVDGDTVYSEHSLVIYLSDTEIDDVLDAADEMIEVFRQSSVLIQENQSKTTFYSGPKG